ncbi:hypothetical protein GCM10022140_08440 [Rhodococcus aetherivorans]
MAEDYAGNSIDGGPMLRPRPSASSPGLQAAEGQEWAMNTPDPRNVPDPHAHPGTDPEPARTPDLERGRGVAPGSTPPDSG